jgi:c-di-GMP-binding flagellar brake protein YcgR
MPTILNPDNPVRLQELSPYQVTSRREIVALLRALQQHNQLITMLVGGGADPVITTVLDVDEENELVYLDCAPTPAQNRRIAASDNVSFETVLDHIRILFFTSEIREDTHDNLPALVMPIPPSVIRLQRREFYRVQTPISNPVRCTLQITHDLGVENVTVPLKNVSTGGVAIVDEKKALDNTIGLVYKDCQIHLPGNTTVITSLQVRNSQDVTLPNGKVVRRIGCLFIDLPKSMLTAIQRYITKLEREQNAKTSGMLK